MKSAITSHYHILDTARVHQGDILVDFEIPYWKEDGAELEDRKLKIPFTIVLSQDCDLSTDSRTRIENKDEKDSFLHSVLVCPAYPAEKIKTGIHLESLRMKARPIPKCEWEKIQLNQIPRYHWLETFTERYIPSLVIDFKHYYAFPTSIFYKDFKKSYRCSINELYRDSLSQRFAYYLSRVGLPDKEKNEQGRADEMPKTKTMAEQRG